MPIDVIVPEADKATYEKLHFAPAVHHDGLIFCSGVIGSGDTAEEEFRDAWQKVGRTLEAAGASYADIVDTTLYMVDPLGDARAMMTAKDEFIKEPYPASTWIGTTGLVIPGARAEIKVVARRP
jgi:enamine deaminase RidA (YjgF/YER057c/UK114 family)